MLIDIHFGDGDLLLAQLSTCLIDYQLVALVIKVTSDEYRHHLGVDLDAVPFVNISVVVVVVAVAAVPSKI